MMMTMIMMAVMMMVVMVMVAVMVMTTTTTTMMAVATMVSVMCPRKVSKQHRVSMRPKWVEATIANTCWCFSICSRSVVVRTMAALSFSAFWIASLT